MVMQQLTTNEYNAFIKGFLEELGIEKDASWESAVIEGLAKIAPKVENFGEFGKNLSEFTNVASNYLNTGEDALKAFLKSNAPAQVLKQDGKYIATAGGKVGTEGGVLSSYIPNFLSEASRYTQNLTANVGETPGLWNKTKQIVNNFGQSEVDALRNSRYMIKSIDEVNAGNLNIVAGKNGDMFLQRNQGMFSGMKNKIMNPEALSFTDGKWTAPEGTNIIAKKKLPMQAVGATVSGPGTMTATGVLMGDTPGESFKDSLGWTPLTRPFGEIHAATRIAGTIKNLF